MFKSITFLALTLVTACSVAMPPDNPVAQETRNVTAPTQTASFKRDEAKKLLEFCIELNNQDDRVAHPGENQYVANLDGWQINYDSLEGKGTDVKTNGFGPFNNAWLLLRSKTDPTHFAVAIRGTVAEATSMVNDALVATLPANSGIEFPKNRHLPIVFAKTDKAEVHQGFSYGAFVLLFDKDLGILKHLRETNLPDNATLFVTGHSQGAAIATLIHSFLYYAKNDPTDRYRLGLGTKKVQLKSYFFAQPKPGNLQYAMDIAHIAGQEASAFAINNDIDPVPRVPLSIQTPTDAIGDVISENKNKGLFFERIVTGGLNLVFKQIMDARNSIAAKARSETAEKLNSHYDKNGGNAADHLDLTYFKADEKPVPKPAGSMNYTLSGQLLPVFGLVGGGNLYKPTSNSPEWLLQHHATTYRVLIDKQL